MLKESKTPSNSNLKRLLLTMLGLLVTLDGKSSQKSKDLSEERGKENVARNRLTKLLDNGIVEVLENSEEPPRGPGSEEEISGNNTSGSKVSGSDLCGVLLTLYDGAQSTASKVSDEERSLVCSVLSSVLAVSHSAKHAALQGEDFTANLLFLSDICCLKLLKNYLS